MGLLRLGLARLSFLLIAFFVASSYQTCASDEDCSLNGVCGSSGVCQCDPAWTGDDCGALDIRPAQRPSGYNLTAEGTSSWCSKIVKDPWEKGLYHLFASEFTHGCGLDYWAPYSRIIRAESKTGPAGPYTFAAETQTFTCGPGNDNNGESGISVLSSKDLRNWTFKGQVMQGDNTGDWDADVTNPAPFPLYASSCSRTGTYENGQPCPGHTDALLLVYRGCPYNCGGAEQINVAISETGFEGPYTKIEPDPIFDEGNEDPFVWRDKRGNFHLLLHSLEADGAFGSGPKVGRHAWAKNYTGPWTFGNQTLAFSTEVEYDDGTTINFYRRERPELYFSDDGLMTPLLLTTGVQPQNSPQSYSIVVPLGDAGVKAQEPIVNQYLDTKFAQLSEITFRNLNY